MKSNLDLDGVAPLPGWGVIRAAGADAATFLQGQLTNDVVHLDIHRARLAGYCSAKGRLLASFVVLRSASDEFLLLCPAALVAGAVKRLSMFVLRAKCKLTDASGALPVHGAVGETARALAGDLLPWAGKLDGGAWLLRWPDAEGHARLTSLGAGPALAALPGIDAAAWNWVSVRSGVPIVEAATVEQFVPQMVNFERVGGVDFAKGCYPGQEVVARSQYRGTIKRRMFLFETDAVAAAGQEVFHSADPGQPAGMVVNAAGRPGGGATSLLAEVKLAALDGGTLHLASADGPVLTLSEQPYDLPLDAAA